LIVSLLFVEHIHPDLSSASRSAFNVSSRLSRPLLFPSLSKQRSLVVSSLLLAAVLVFSSFSGRL
jgi:hypothetical protein